ncbi:MAG TPA: gluconate 2-dehydrogenase subunit 3 family protein [Vicinamibacterales bacterium]|nr:gluconate 2-dehydrogenase subunit 3 family protein [Vicinamibacterales bacterium]
MDRRTALSLLAAAPAAGALAWTDAEARDAVEQATAARRAAARAKQPYVPKFFTAAEYALLVALVDSIIPKDERSGSASDAGVPEFIDFLMADQPARQVAMRGGLARIERLCLDRYDRGFVACTAAQRTEVLDDIGTAGNALARPELSQAVAFFNSLRDLTATGFWSSRMGVTDLQYSGNVYVAEWKGCPEEALKKLGVE